MISNLTGFDNLRAVMEGEATVNKRKRRRRNRNRKNNNDFQFHAQQPVPVDDEKPAIDTELASRDEDVRTVEVSKWDLIEISNNDVPQKLPVDTAVKENKMMETVQAVKLRTGSTGDEAGPKEVINLCSLSSEDDGLISNIISRKGTGEMVSAEATINEDGKTVRRKELKNVVAEETGQYCFVCRGGHQANDCPEKQEENKNYIICLRCGDSGHYMFSCRSDYSPDDLKKIRCYICNDFGHLSCVKLSDTSSTEVSCYNCGQSGHLGSECSKCPKVAGGSKSPALCYRCREEGHFARTCTLSRKAKMRRSMGSSSAPRNCGPQNNAKDAKGEIQESLIINI